MHEYLAIIGSRKVKEDNWEIYEKALLDTLHKYNCNAIVSGGAAGADTIGEIFAAKHNLPKFIFYPKWKQHGKAAGFIRNSEIANACTAVAAIWDGTTKGTGDTIVKARKQGKPIVLIDPETGEIYADDKAIIAID